MKAQILSTEDFGYSAEIRKLALAGSYCFTVTSTWLGAANPTAEHTAVLITLDTAGLVALRELIDAELQS